MNKKQRSIDVAIHGYYGFDNFGDEENLALVIKQLKIQKPDIKIVAFTNNPIEMSKKLDVLCVSRLNYYAMRKYLKKTKIMLLGPGSLLQDSTRLLSLKYYCDMAKMAKRAGAKLFIYANGIGPLYTKLGNIWVKNVLKKADRISVRDSVSKKKIIDLGINEDRVDLSADPSFMFDKEITSSLSVKGMESFQDKKYFVVNLRQCSGRFKYQIDVKKLVEQVIDVCKQVKKQYDLEPVFVSMQHFYDSPICLMAQNLMGEGIVLENLNASELCQVLQNASFVAGMRLHFLVYASIVNTPMVAISYDLKVDSFMKDLGMQEPQSVYDFDKNVFLTQIQYVLNNREKVKNEIKNNIANRQKLAILDIKNVIDMLN